MADSFQRAKWAVSNPENFPDTPLAPPVNRDSLADARLEGDGLQVCLRAIKGMTDPDILRSPFYFQCPPLDAFTRSYSYSFTDYNTISRGQFSRPSGVDLATVNFQSLFVDFNAPWANLRSNAGYGGVAPAPGIFPDGPRSVPDWPNPVDMTRDLLRILRQGTPFELIVGQQELWGSSDVHWGPTNGNAATLRTLEVEERAGEVDARYVNVSFTEFRTPELVRRGEGKTKGKNRDPKRGRNLPTSTSITRESTATLASLSSHYYGTASKWRLIAKANGITNWPQNRPLDEYVKARGEKRMTLSIPEPGDFGTAATTTSTWGAN